MRTWKTKSGRNILGAAALAVAIVATSTAARAAEPAKGTAPGDPVVAKVGAVEIRRSEFEFAWQALPPDARTKLEAGGGRPAFLRQLADRKRLAARAEKDGIAARPEVKAELAAVRDSLLVQRWTETVAAPAVVSEEEVKALYESRRGSFQAPLRLRARHILVTPKQEPKPWNRLKDDAKTEEEARAKIALLEKKLRAGADFGPLAADYSEDRTAERGGDLGFFGKDAMVPAFEKAVLALEPGEISPVVRTEFGFHLIRLEERFDEGVLPFEVVRESLRAELLAQQSAQLEEKVRAAAASMEGEMPLVVVDPALAAPAGSR